MSFVNTVQHSTRYDSAVPYDFAPLINLAYVIVVLLMEKVYVSM